MSVFIQDRTTGKFIFSAESWTDRLDEALDLEDTGRALGFCRCLRLKDVQIVVKSGVEEQVLAVAEERPSLIRLR